MPQAAPRLVPRTDLVNVLEYESQARLVLDPATFSRVAGSERSGFDRITLRPRMLMPTADLDLALTLFGLALHSPILVGPIDTRGLARADAAAEIAAGARAAHTPVMATALPAEPGGGEEDIPFGLQIFARDAAASERARQAAAAGCRVVCVTVGAAEGSGGVRRISVGAADWRVVGALVRDAGVPVIVKGMTQAADAKRAVEQGASGIVFSDYGGLLDGRDAASILDLPAIVDAVGRSVPVLADGHFRRGTDILKALAFGARAVLVARPIVWGLAAYGAPGVQGVLEMLQTELARYMAMCGQASLDVLDRTLVRVHAR